MTRRVHERTSQQVCERVFMKSKSCPHATITRLICTDHITAAEWHSLWCHMALPSTHKLRATQRENPWKPALSLITEEKLSSHPAPNCGKSSNSQLYDPQINGKSYPTTTSVSQKWLHMTLWHFRNKNPEGKFEFFMMFFSSSLLPRACLRKARHQLWLPWHWLTLSGTGQIAVAEGWEN